MSVSLSMVPAALAMRIAMGNSHFQQWVEAMQVKVPTSFTDVQELERTVRRAGYDIDRMGGVVRTGFQGEDLYFLWEWIDGKWTAIFAKSDSPEKIERFISDLNRAAGQNVIELSKAEELDAGMNEPAADHSAPSVFPTNFRDGEILLKTLREFGMHPVRSGDSIQCKVENTTLIFRQVQDGPYQVEIQNAPDLRKVFAYLSDLDEVYKLCLQSMVYEKLKKRAAEKNITIESEEVLADNSIVITMSIDNQE